MSRRVLFVSSTTTGGSGRSQRSLARALIERGHEVRFVVDDKRPAVWTRRIGERLADAAERFGSVGVLRRLEERTGARLADVTIDGIDMWATPLPQNGVVTAIDRFEPDVIVGSSMVRFSWRRIRERAAASGRPTVLYIREVTSLDALDIEPDPADAIAANARSLCAGAEERGWPCTFVPSLVDTAATDVESSREVALLVNPAATHGIDRLWEIAAALPEISFVIQESWELEPDQLAAVEAGLAAHPNVVLRRRRPPGPELYADARVLLVPHRIDNRPRVIVEAQANAIPSLVSDFGGLREAVGSGGAVVPDEPDAWIDAVRTAFTDDAQYAAWQAAAAAEAERPELGEDAIVDGFLSVVDAAIAAAGR